MIRLATFNIQYGAPVPAEHATAIVGVDRAGEQSARQLARDIAALEADVLGLQDVARGKIRSGRVDQLRVIAERTGLTPLFAETRHKYGMALLTRLPVMNARVLELAGRTSPWIRDDSSSVGWRFKWPDKRACLYALLDTPEGPLAVGVTHLSTVRPVARRQFQIAARGCEDFAPGVPAVLMGDLNLRINQVEEEIPGTGFAILARGNASPSWAPIIQIDHILGRGVTGRANRVVQMPVSDHAAVVVEARIDAGVSKLQDAIQEPQTGVPKRKTDTPE